MIKLVELYKNNLTPNYIIYCDMDGVICDFDARFDYFTGMSPKEYEEKFGIKKFWNLIDDQIGIEFWSKIPWMPEGKILWEYIRKYNPILLSAPSQNNESRIGKRIWVETHINKYLPPPAPKIKLILASRENKQNYSEKNSILIDDREDTIKEWNSRGGIGILFESTEQTINDLKKLGL